MDTHEIVNKYFEYVNSGRWDDYLALFADDIVMDEQILGHAQGIAEVRKNIEVLRNNSGFHNYPGDIVAEGNLAMATWHISALQPDGTTLQVSGANFYRIKDGKIVYFSNYHDTAPFQVKRKS